MPKCCIWTLITDGVSARVCSTEDSTTTPLPMHGLTGFDFGPNERGPSPSLPWLSPGRRFLRGGKRLFAASLAQFLSEAGQEDVYQRLVIIAAPQIAAELNAALAPETRARLIGKIIRDFAEPDSPETSFTELRH